MRWSKEAAQGCVIAGGNDSGGKSNQLNNPVGLSFDRHDKYMDDLKRKSSFNYLSKKFRKEIDQSITCIENLSNECFYEIFDYLEACDMYEAFSNLNYRFQQLLHSSALLLKIKFYASTSEEMFKKNYEQIIVHSRHQIYAINLWTMDDWFLTMSLCLINSSCDRLESLVVVGIELDLLFQLLTHYTCLPRLFSLGIDTESSSTLEELSDIYQLIFALPKLKSVEFSIDIFDNSNSTLPLSIATNEQFSGIKRLYLDQGTNFKELFSIVSYTPELCHLKLSHAEENDNDEPSTANVLPISLLKLIDFSIDRYEMRFDGFQWFIKNIFWKLKVLYINFEYEDMKCFDGNRWEQLIRQHLPQLKNIYLTYDERNYYEHKLLKNAGQLNQFFSSFWIERQTIMEIEIHDSHIKYVIRPYRKSWYEYLQNNAINSSVQLILRNANFEEYFPLLKSHIDDILTVGQIYHLEISKVCSNTFIEIINLLPKLDSLKISSLSLKQSNDLSTHETELLSLISNKNQITKVNLETITNIEEVNFFLELCPRIIYLKVDFINNIDMELFVRHILIKINTKCNHQLRLLCFCKSAADDQTIKTLQTMIHSEKLLLDYTIKRIVNNIYLEWK
ncbi:unnamed protein product [Rotaria magnacalcarata]|uniref:F-box domain-containing protein n=1 Tax=Rotaria magnacalcarata TaxID=392030 RepID=A0A815N7G7_9BILA|nr:unnamed protein product [Rotaria magnacalcarata]CAF2115520.1 unnamed protein product [Rotaria magnacalcarata]CAF4006538.1 unnamed protein product [Rotaria magnacalcarata]CAF4049398.1 unnamed protein product [Rotaria magnacalcarata]